MTQLGADLAVDGRVNLTRHEWSALANRHNLADGHARHGQGTAEATIVSDLPALFDEAERSEQLVVQSAFEESFYRLAGQHSVIERARRPLHHYSSSLSTEVVANHLRLVGARVGLLHPTFDNIAAILRRQGVSLTPIAEEIFKSPRADRHYADCDAIFLVVPNNPTGTDPDPEAIMAVATHCAATGRLLVIDTSFRFFSRQLPSWDQYAAFDALGLRYIGIEDTGKTWPTLDLKVGSLVCDGSLHEPLQRITDDCLLNVSAFVFRILREYVEVDGAQRARAVADANRKVLMAAVADAPWDLLPCEAQMSVAWLRLPDGWDSVTTTAQLAALGVSVLPGGPFFWADHDLGLPYVRIALMRSPETFAEGARALRWALDEIARGASP